MIELKFSFQVTIDGEVRIQNKDKFLKDMSNFPNTLFTATFKKASKKRTVRQNSYFHLLLGIIKDHLLDLGWTQAYSLEWVKNYVKMNCLVVEEQNEETGEVIRTIGETSSLSTKEFAEFIERVQLWASQPDGLDLYLPNSGEQLTIDNNKGMYPTIQIS